VDATLVTAHSDKEGAAATFKRGYGHHPLWSFVDHGPDGTGEPLSVLLRPGNAGSNTAADHITLLRNALRQLPGHRAGIRPGVIARKERPHPGAQLRITDADGLRVTAFATNTTSGGPGRQLPDLELRHRRRARAEDRIRCAKDTGLTNLPLHDLDQNRIWCALVALACEITAWTQMLALAQHPARRWEPKRLRLRLFSIAGRLARSGRRTVLHLAEHAPWAALLLQALTTLRASTATG
jgi:hypothetical protein